MKKDREQNLSLAQYLETYAVDETPRGRATLEARYGFAAQYLNPRSHGLDVGCGTGFGTRYLADRCALAVGIDIHEEVVTHAAIRYGAPNVVFRQGDILSMPLDGVFDVITAFELIEHLEDPDLFLTKISTHLKPEGVLIVSTPNKLRRIVTQTEIGRYHVHEYYFSGLLALLSRHFEDVRILGRDPTCISRLVDKRIRDTERQFLYTRMRRRILRILSGTLKVRQTEEEKVKQDLVFITEVSEVEPDVAHDFIAACKRPRATTDPPAPSG